MSASLGRSLRGGLSLVTGAALAVGAMAAPAATLRAQDADAQLASYAPEPYTAEELDNLLAPVALYPDPILAQVLVASTFPEQVELAARHVRLYGSGDVDQQPWDISVRALAHYAPVLNLLADRIDWTTALGQAHVTQPGDVMNSVQSLRRMARAQGNLVTTAQQEVIVEDRNIYIVPAQPRVIYVPTYDPLVIYHRPVVHIGVYRSGWSFGLGFPVGVWLNYDFDWNRRHVYYHGWHDFRHHHHQRWYPRSRPYIVVNNIYVNRRHTTIVVNRQVIHRRVHFDRMYRYNQVHRRVTWDRRREVEDRRQVSRRGYEGPSWDRNGARRNAGSASPGRAVPRRVASGAPTSDGPSWDRTRRTAGGPGAAPQRTSPQRATPQRTTPQRTTPQRATPQRTTPQRATPQRTTPQRATPQRTAPQRTAPQRTSPQRAAPQRSAPPRTSAQRPAPTPRAQPARTSGRSAPRAAQSRPSRAPAKAAPRSNASRSGGAVTPRSGSGRRPS